MAARNNLFAIYTATGRILAMLCNFVVPLFLTRYLTQGDYGLYSQFYMVLTFTGSIFAFGLQSNLYYYYPGASNEEQKSLIGNTFVVLLFFALLAFIFVEIPWTSQLFIKDYGLVDYKTVIAISILLYIPSFILFPLFVIKGDKVASVLFPALEIIIKVLFVIGSTLIFHELKYILYCLFLYQFFVFCYALGYTYYSQKAVDGSWVNWALLHKQIKYAAPFGCAIVLATLTRQLDKIICISYITAEEYAIYSLAFYGIPGINQVYDSVAEVNLLNMSDSYKQGDKEDTHRLYKSFCTKLLSFSVPIIAVVFLFASDIFGLLFSKEYLAAVPYFRIYIFSFLFGALGAGTVLRATGKTRYTLNAYLFSMIFYLPFSFFSIRYYGTWGAIITAMLGLFLPKVFQIYYERNLLGVSLRKYMPWADFVKIGLISILFLIPVIFIHYIYHLNILIVAVVSVLYLLVVYYYEIQKSLFIIDKSVLLKVFNKFKITNKQNR